MVAEMSAVGAMSPGEIGGTIAAAAACLFWLACLPAGLLLLRRVAVLESTDCPDPPRWPSLSIVVPARDEAESLLSAAESRLASGYPDLQLVLVDDRSTDGTGALADALAARDERVSVVHLGELPEGWLGKTRALQRGLEVARGDWVLFTDADVHLAPGALRRAVALAEARGWDHLAVLPDLWSRGVALDATLAAFGRLFLLATRAWNVGNPRSRAAAGVGAFNLVRRSALERIGGLRRVRLAVGDDVALAEALKASGARAGLALGRGLVGLHWYASVGSLARGLEKGLYGHGARCEAWRLYALALWLLAVEVLPWVALSLPGPPWVTWLGALTLLVNLCAALVGARWAGRPLTGALLLPFGSLLLVWIVARAGWVGARRGGVLWRGTFHSAALLREGYGWDSGWRGDVPRA